MTFPVSDRPDRVTIGSVLTRETLEAEFNPVEFTEKVRPMYARIAPLGNSHLVLQYTHTENHSVDFDLAFSVFTREMSQTQALAKIQDARRFLLSLCYASKRSQTVVEAKPSDVLFVWPTMIAFTTVITDLKIKHTDFNKRATSTRFVASITIDENRTTKLFAEDVRSGGTMRGGS